MSVSKKRMSATTLLIVGLGLVALIVLVAFLVWPEAEDNVADAGAQTTAEEQEGSTEADFTQFERRDSVDLLAAGPIDAPVGLIVFSDYQCPYCAQWNHETLPTMMELAERGELRIEWRDLNVFGPDSERASLAAYAAAQQGKYWEYHEVLFANGEKRPASELSEGALVALAGELGLDTTRFAADMNSDETRTEIAQNQQLGYSLGAASTPVFLLGGVPISGAQPTEVFVQTFENAIAQQG